MACGRWGMSHSACHTLDATWQMPHAACRTVNAAWRRQLCHQPVTQFMTSAPAHLSCLPHTEACKGNCTPATRLPV
eukprot:365631-Chlamydomonas_euryale.AAC.1